MKLSTLLAAGILGSGAPYANRVLATQAANLIAYWKLDEAAGSATVTDSKSSLSGTVGANITLGGAGASSRVKTCAASTGSTAAINIYSAALNTAFNPAEMTVALWATVTPAVWSDGLARVGILLRTDVSNRVFLGRHTSNNNLSCFYTAGGTNKTANWASGTADWFHLAITVSKAADEVRIYYNGAQQGATLTGLGTWVGALNSGQCQIGGPATFWEGKLDEVAIWTKALTPAEIAALAVL